MSFSACISGIRWSIASKFFEMKCYTAFNLTKNFEWSVMKYLFTVMKNVLQFSRSIGNSMINLFFDFFLNDNILGFWIVNNFKTLHMYLKSIK